MGDEPEDRQALLMAINAMRNELDTVIVEELGRLRVGRLEPRRSTGPSGVIDLQEEGPASRVSESVRERRGSPSWEGPRFLSDDPEPASRRTLGEDEAGGEDSGESERRLDALALRLEGRLRRTRDREAHRHRPDDEEETGPGRDLNGAS